MNPEKLVALNYLKLSWDLNSKSIQTTVSLRPLHSFQFLPVNSNTWHLNWGSILSGYTLVEISTPIKSQVTNHLSYHPFYFFYFSISNTQLGTLTFFTLFFPLFSFSQYIIYFPIYFLTTLIIHIIFTVPITHSIFTFSHSHSSHSSHSHIPTYLIN